MKIRWTLRNPAQEFRNAIVASQEFDILPEPGQFRIRELCVERAVADRMHRDRFAALAAFRHRVMVLDPAAERSLT
ncbi:hypothetical protein [Croceicoccus hydrothermalis]|uniref:hypothetical protein n=1 Tax=Croceicoccus hydrothermalis TaxID=2867964 RepID=UPI003B82DE10